MMRYLRRSWKLAVLCSAICLIVFCQPRKANAITVTDGDQLLVEYNFLSTPTQSSTQLLVSYTGPTAACANAVLPGPSCVFGKTYANGFLVGGFGINRYVDPPLPNVMGSGVGSDISTAFTIIDIVGGTWDITGFTLYGTCNGTCIGDTVAATLTLNPETLPPFSDTPLPSSTPVPAALPLFATGLGALGLLGWRRKRKATASADTVPLSFTTDPKLPTPRNTKR